MTSDTKHTMNRMEALIMLLGCPLWPPRDWLGEQGKALYDAILTDHKAYATAIAEERYTDALETAGKWSVHVEQMLDSVRIDTGDNSGRMMLEVYKYFVDLFPADLSKINAR